MPDTYTTRQGDAWDAIAHRVYGDVKYTGWLMEHNHPQQAIWDGIVGGIKSLLGIGGGDKSSKSGGKSARSAAAPMALSEDDEGGGISTYALSRARGIAALESAIPAAQSRVAIATAAMAPSAGYSAPPTASYGNSDNGGRSQAPIVVRPQVVVRFDGELAQFAQVFKGKCTITW